ncbi:MAG: hypothetical protein WCI04_03235 [archaeon]
MVRIAPPKWAFTFLAGLFGSISLIGIGLLIDAYYFTYHGDVQQGIFFGWALALFPVFGLIIYFLFGIGHHLDIDSNGINIGKRYYGPLNIKEKMNIWKIPKKKDVDKIIPWNSIKAIYIGEWDRFWSRYSSLMVANLADPNISNPDQILTAIGIPVKRVELNFLTIETNAGEIYSYDLTPRFLADAEYEIKKQGKEKLIDSSTYRL